MRAVALQSTSLGRRAGDAPRVPGGLVGIDTSDIPAWQPIIHAVGGLTDIKELTLNETARLQTIDDYISSQPPRDDCIWGFGDALGTACTQRSWHTRLELLTGTEQCHTTAEICPQFGDLAPSAATVAVLAR